jgi:DNA-directed RNA polymerase specialized sigma24 family protein
LLDVQWFAIVDRLAASESRRRRLRPDDAEEFRSHVGLRFAERGDRILAAHDGRSAVETYLHVVVARAFVDWQRSRWGYWRPSAQAVRLGPIAIELDRRLSHFGESFESAAAAILSRFGSETTRDELEQIRRRLPERAQHRPLSADALENLPATTESAEDALNARERASIARRIRPVLRRALYSIDPVDRLALLLVFRDGLSVRAAARAVRIEHKKMVRRLNRALGQLRAAMEEGGLDRYAVLLLLEAPDDGEGGFPWDNGPRRPSHEEAEP